MDKSRKYDVQHNGILFRLRKEGNPIICKKHGGHNAKRSSFFLLPISIPGIDLAQVIYPLAYLWAFRLLQFGAVTNTLL